MAGDGRSHQPDFRSETVSFVDIVRKLVGKFFIAGMNDDGIKVLTVKRKRIYVVENSFFTLALAARNLFDNFELTLFIEGNNYF